MHHLIDFFYVIIQQNKVFKTNLKLQIIYYFTKIRSKHHSLFKKYFATLIIHNFFSLSTLFLHFLCYKFICIYHHTYYMKVQEPYELESPLYDSSAFIPANYNYFNIRLDSEYQMDVPSGLYIVPFQTHETTFKQILQELLKSLSLTNKILIDKIQLSLKSGYVVKKKSTAQDLRIKLCRQSASGITLQAKIMGQVVNQAAVIFYINAEPDFNKNNINKWFLLLNNQEPFSISITKFISFKDLQQSICNALNIEYKNQISPPHLSFYRIKKSEQEISFSWEKVNELVKDEVTKRIAIDEHQIIGVEVGKEDAKWPYSQVASEEYLIFHVSDNNKIKLRFSMIAKYKVSELLKQLKIQNASDCNLGIKIVEQIFPPCKQIKEASKYFQTGAGKYVKNVECRLASEKEMFYYSMQRIPPNFKIEKEMVTKKKEEHFQKCQDLARRRCRQLEEANKKHFTNYEQISPITLYTSSVQVIDPISNDSDLLGRSLNNHLRSNMFGQCDNYHNQWQYKFSAKLIKSLEKIEPYRAENKEKTIVYRCISGHQLKGQVGQLYVSKYFLSTSTNKEKGLKFAKKHPIGTFIQIDSLTGRSIKQFSVYSKEEEILFRPYTYFRIVEKDASGPIFKIKLTQLPANQYQSNPATIILWVDDKPKEGQKVITSLQCPMHTTFLHQLMSTCELDQWINNNQQLVKNSKVKKIVIININMKKTNVKSLVNTYQLLKSRISNCWIALQHFDQTQPNLQSLLGLKVEGLKILHSKSQLQQFIAEMCSLDKQEEKQEIVKQATKKIQQLFNKLYSPSNNKYNTIKSQINFLREEKNKLLELQQKNKINYLKQINDLQNTIKQIQNRMAGYHFQTKQFQQRLKSLDNKIQAKQHEINKKIFQSVNLKYDDQLPANNWDYKAFGSAELFSKPEKLEKKEFIQSQFDSIDIYQKKLLKVRQQHLQYKEKYQLDVDYLREKNKALQLICKSVQEMDIINAFRKITHIQDQYIKYQEKYNKNSSDFLPSSQKELFNKFRKQKASK